MNFEDKIKSCTAYPTPQLKGRTPHEYTTGETPDTMGLVQLQWYGIVYYWHELQFIQNKECLARFLGVAQKFGIRYVFLCLTIAIQDMETITLSRSTAHNLTEEERLDPKIKE